MHSKNLEQAPSGPFDVAGTAVALALCLCCCVCGICFAIFQGKLLFEADFFFFFLSDGGEINYHSCSSYCPEDEKYSET